MTKLKTPQTPKERLEHAKRLLKNAKQELENAGIDRKAGIYEDLKYISGASGMAYLSALEALKALFISQKLLDNGSIPKNLKNVNVYQRYISKLTKIGKDRDVIRNVFDEIYKLLHIGGYYRELRDKKAIDSGFEKVEKLIKIVEKYVK